MEEKVKETQIGLAVCWGMEECNMLFLTAPGHDAYNLNKKTIFNKLAARDRNDILLRWAKEYVNTEVMLDIESFFNLKLQELVHALSWRAATDQLQHLSGLCL